MPLKVFNIYAISTKNGSFKRADRRTHRQTDGIDSITSTADARAGGNKRSMVVVEKTAYDSARNPQVMLVFQCSVF